MKKIVLVLLMFLLVAGCTGNKTTEVVDDEVTDQIKGNGHLYQEWSEVPLLTDDSYLDFYFIHNTEGTHSELIFTEYWKVTDMLNRFEYYDHDEETFTLKQSIFGMEDGVKYDEMLQTRKYDMTVTKDESYWVDYDENGEVFGVSLNVMEYGNHAPYVLTSYYSLEDDLLECDRNDLTDEYPDGGKEAIVKFVSSFEKETIDSQKLLKELETDLYFYDEDEENEISCYIGPESLQMVLTNMDTDEDGRYIRGFLSSGNDCKLYIDENDRIIQIVMGSKTITYEYLDDYVIATCKKRNDEVVYKYDYERNPITE